MELARGILCDNHLSPKHQCKALLLGNAIIILFVFVFLPSPNYLRRVPSATQPADVHVTIQQRPLHCAANKKVP